jgi:hypothetical protein
LRKESDNMNSAVLCVQNEPLAGNISAKNSLRPIIRLAARDNEPKLTTEINYEGTVYEVSGFFKTSGRTFSEKIFGIMSKELDKQAVLCYNRSIPQKDLTVGIY